ncbi:MAG: hypothetical protein E7390_00810 [Ruminococcaceae bacterium]|nr:hypothetical protein [Oscillospiraceae bacterium]
MKCKGCTMDIGPGFSSCPICGLKQDRFDKTAGFYPKFRKGGHWFFFWRKIAILVLWAGIMASGIVNLAVGGTPWAVYVLLGSYAFYEILLSLETAERSLIRRIVSGSYAVCFLLLGIAYITDSGTWARDLVVPLVLLAALLSAAALYFSDYRRFSAQCLPVLGLSLLSVTAGILGLFHILPMRWPLISLSSTALAVFVGSICTFRRSLWMEVKKKMHR